ncbi:MAG: DUF3145 family protein [Canibacter sp.]
MSSAKEYASGLLIVHSAPNVLAAHIEWMLASSIGHPVSLNWQDQPVLADTVRTTAQWRAPAGTGAQVASGLLGWRGVRFEITEFGTSESDGGRWMHTPALGIIHQSIDRAGNTLMNETQVRDCFERAQGDASEIARLVERALGTPWDAELDIFRAAEHHEGAEILRMQRTVS